MAEQNATASPPNAKPERTLSAACNAMTRGITAAHGAGANTSVIRRASRRARGRAATTAPESVDTRKSCTEALKPRLTGFAGDPLTVLRSVSQICETHYH